MKKKYAVDKISNKNKFPKSLIVTDVREPLIKDSIETKWLEWWDQAEDIEKTK